MGKTKQVAAAASRAGRKSRTKGAVGERELAQFLRDHGCVARRGRQFQGSDDSPDVVCDLPGFHFECKRVESGNPYKWLAQATNDAGLKVPVVAHRRNKGHWIAILSLSDFLNYVVMPAGASDAK